jgi:hypothetical protein
MYNAERRSQSHTLYTSTPHARASIAPAPAPRRHIFSLDAILEALRWVGELHAMPFVGLEMRPQNDDRAERGY